jgi:hypothetical protein
MAREPKLRVVGWGLFRLPGEQRRDEAAFQRARDDMLRARGSVNERGLPVDVKWDATAAARIAGVAAEPSSSASLTAAHFEALEADSLGTVTGKDVYDESGERIGAAAEVYLDDVTGEPEWLKVRTDLPGSKQAVVPLWDADLIEESVYVQVSKAQVRDAPRIDAQGHLSPEEEQELNRYYFGAPGGSTATLVARRTDTGDRSSLADELRERYDAGESIRSLASSTNRSYGFVHRLLSESGATLRSRGGANRNKQSVPKPSPRST